MRKREAIFAILGALLLASAWVTAHDTAPQHTTVEAGSCRVPISVFQSSAAPGGSAVMLHGLSANRRTMFVLAAWLSALGLKTYAMDLPGHGDNTEPFSFKRAETCAREAVEELSRSGEIDLRRTVLVGHSMGGTIAIRMAEKFDTAATIAISPAPLVPLDSVFRRVLPYQMPATRPSNLLLLSAEYEPPELKRATQALTATFGPQSTEPDAFTRRAALRWSEIPGATHVSLLLDRAAMFEIFQWATRNQIVEVHDTYFVVFHFLPLAAYPLAILLLFPLATTLLCRAAGYNVALDVSEGSGRIGIAPMRIAGAWAVASVLTVLILWLWVPLRFLRIYTGDYLASFFLLSGVVLSGWHLAETVRWRRRHFGETGYVMIDPWTTRRPLATGVAVGVVTFLAVGWWLNTQWYDAWMNAERWWRFAVLVPLVLPYFWVEELALDKLSEEKQVRRYTSLRRWGIFLLLRIITWAAMAAALWLLDSQQVLIVLMTMFLLAFSVLQRAGANAVDRRAGRAAAASFSAILAAWFIAAVFPLT